MRTTPRDWIGLVLAVALVAVLSVLFVRAVEAHDPGSHLGFGDPLVCHPGPPRTCELAYPELTPPATDTEP